MQKSQKAHSLISCSYWNNNSRVNSIVWLLLCVGLLLSVSVENVLAQQQFQLIRVKNEINLYQIKHSAFDHRLPVIRAEFELPVDRQRVVCLLRDAKLNPQWVPNSLGAEILEERSANDNLVLFKTRMPFPFKKRDAVIHFQQFDQDNGNVFIRMKSMPDAYPVQRGYLRVPQSEGTWTIASLGDNRSRLTYDNFVDLGGNLPIWMVRAGVKSVTLQTAENFITLASDQDIPCGG